MKWRLFAAFAALIAMILLAQDIPLARYLRSVEYQRVLTDLERDAFILAGSSEDALSGDHVSVPEQLSTSVELYTATHGKARVVIVDRDGRLVVSSDGTTPGGLYTANRPEIAAALAGHPTPGRRPSEQAGGDLVFVAVPVLSGARIVGAVRITHPYSEIDARVWRKQLGLLLVFGCSMLAAVGAALLMASSLNRPLRRLQRSTERVAAGDFALHADADSGPAEIRGLAASFNTMTARIDSLVEQQRAFAGDASHQLRSPLTALRLRLEQAALAVDGDPARLRANLDAAVNETERLQRLIDGLLMLSRAESVTAPLAEVDLSHVAAERAETWSSLAEERGVRVEARTTANTRVLAAPHAVEQIIDNFLDNAVSCAPSGSTIVITTSSGTDWAVVSVIDEGPGLPADQLDRVFDRFWRAADAGYAGSGLGLAIVARLARASGGLATLTNRTDRSGAIAAVRLRRAGVDQS